MGLDTVELVQSIENEFQITIPDDVAPSLGTLGELHAFIVASLQTKTNTAVDSDDAWKRLKQIFIDQFAFRESLLVPSAHIVHDLGLD
jgi:hypothetical protein